MVARDEEATATRPARWLWRLHHRQDDGGSARHRLEHRSGDRFVRWRGDDRAFTLLGFARVVWSRAARKWRQQTGSIAAVVEASTQSVDRTKPDAPAATERK
jgi:hypothetical protein